jgi:hypothetical protein
MRWISSQGVGRDGRQITLAAGTPLVADTHHELATEDPDDLLAGVQVHAPRITGRDAATGDQQALEAVGMAGDKAGPGTGGQLEGREVRHVNQSLPDPRTHASTGLSLAQRAGSSRPPSGQGPEAELALGDDDRGSAHLDRVDGSGIASRASEEHRGTTDLGALTDLDLLAGLDPAVAGEMDR